MIEFTVAAVFREWSALLKALFSPLLRIGFILIGGPLLLEFVLAPSIVAHAFAPNADLVPGSPPLPQLTSTTLAFVFVTPVLFWIGWVYFNAVALWMAGETTKGRRPALGAALGAGALRLLPAIAVHMILTICVAIGLVLLVIPGAIIACIWSAAMPMTVIERAGVFASLKRSAALTRGYRLKIFGINLVMLVGMTALGLVFKFAETMIHLNPATVTVPNIFLNIIFAATIGTVTAAIYITLRRVKEGGFDGDVAAMFD